MTDEINTMLTDEDHASVLKRKKAVYRMTFLHSTTGREVLGDLLEGPLRFFAPASDSETAIRQCVAKEILSLMDLWAGDGQSNSPQQFVSKLARGIEGNKNVGDRTAEPNGRGNKPDRAE